MLPPLTCLRSRPRGSRPCARQESLNLDAIPRYKSPSRCVSSFCAFPNEHPRSQQPWSRAVGRGLRSLKRGTLSSSVRVLDAPSPRVGLTKPSRNGATAADPGRLGKHFRTPGVARIRYGTSKHVSFQVYIYVFLPVHGSLVPRELWPNAWKAENVLNRCLYINFGATFTVRSISSTSWRLTLAERGPGLVPLCRTTPVLPVLRLRTTRA